MNNAEKETNVGPRPSQWRTIPIYKYVLRKAD